MTLDQYDDDGRFLRVTLSDRGVPALIKTASDASASRVKFDEDYALTLHGPFGKEYKYPILDAGNAVSSAIYFSEYGHQLDPTMRKQAAASINDALVSFGFVVPGELSKTASIELGFSEEADGMSLEELFPAGDDMEIVDEAFKGLTPRGRRRLIMQVKTAGVKLSGDQANYGGDLLGDDFGVAVEARKLVVADDAEHDKLDQLIVKCSSVDPSMLVDDLREFDVRNRIVHLYDRFIPDPYLSVYGTTMRKTASAQVEFGNDTVSAEHLGGIFTSNSDVLEEHFGKDVAAGLASDPATVYSSLPDPDKRAIERLCK